MASCGVPAVYFDYQTTMRESVPSHPFRTSSDCLPVAATSALSDILVRNDRRYNELELWLALLLPAYMLELPGGLKKATAHICVLTLYLYLTSSLRQTLLTTSHRLNLNHAPLRYVPRCQLYLVSKQAWFALGTTCSRLIVEL